MDCLLSMKNLVRIRNPTYEEGIVKVSGAEDLNNDNSFTLKLARTLASATFALFDTNLVALADPNFAEESVSQGRVTVTLDEAGQICALSKIGAGASSPALLRQCLGQARERAQELRQLMKQ